MSYPYPQDRHRDRKEKGDQPYQDAKEAMTQQDAVEPIERQGPSPGTPALSSLSEGGDDVPADVREQLRATGEEAGTVGRDGE